MYTYRRFQVSNILASTRTGDFKGVIFWQGSNIWHVHVQEISREWYFGFDFCACALHHFLIKFGVRHRKKAKKLFIFLLLEMQSSKFNWWFKKLACARTWDFKGVLFWLPFLYLFALPFFWSNFAVRHWRKTKKFVHFFLLFEMRGSKIKWRFEKLACTHAGDFRKVLFWLWFDFCACSIYRFSDQKLLYVKGDTPKKHNRFFSIFGMTGS